METLAEIKSFLIEKENYFKVQEYLLIKPIKTEKYVAFAKDTPGLPLVAKWKNYITVRIQLNRQFDSIICGITGFVDHLSEDKKRDLMLLVNNQIWGGKLCMKSGEMALISSLQFEMYKNIEEGLIVEAVQDLAGCADKIHEIIYN